MKRSRSPHGERGLKFQASRKLPLAPSSLPPRGAWIEMIADCGLLNNTARRSPHGERGLKSPQKRSRTP